LHKVASASRARVVSLRPAVSTTDQCVVANTGERSGSSFGFVVSDAGLEVLNKPEPSGTQRECKFASRRIGVPLSQTSLAG